MDILVYIYLYYYLISFRIDENKALITELNGIELLSNCLCFEEFSLSNEVINALWYLSSYKDNSTKIRSTKLLNYFPNLLLKTEEIVQYYGLGWSIKLTGIYIYIYIL